MSPVSTLSRTVVVVVVVSLLVCNAYAQLSNTFYASSCPNLEIIVRSVMTQAVNKEARMGASILRLHFHDCFVQGCDASVLLDDTPSMTGEKNAFPNQNSLRGYDVIDAIKLKVEASCKATVSCADILALAARDSVNLLGGPTWKVPLGRRDSLSASQNAANSQLPNPASSLSTLISNFNAKGLNPTDLVALSGAHTVGDARCSSFRSHIYNDGNTDPTFATTRMIGCPASGNDDILSPLDYRSRYVFDNDYYQNLVNKSGLLHSDQELFNGGSTDSLVKQYSTNGQAFNSDFATAMVKMSNLSPLTGSQGQIRLNCRKVN